MLDSRDAVDVAQEWVSRGLMTSSGVAVGHALAVEAVSNLLLLQSPGRMLLSGLVIQIVSEFDLVWRGDVAPGYRVSFWRPRAPSGFAAGCDVVVSGSTSPPGPVTVFRLNSTGVSGQGAAVCHSSLR